MTPFVLAVASTGGHLDELHMFAPRFAADGKQVVWVTAATAQSKSLLHGERVVWVPQVGARQVGRVLLGLPRAMRVVRKYRPQMLVSTGAALSVAYLVAARLQGIETHYVESATRIDGPSMTGRIAQALPGVNLHRQTSGWQRPGGNWRRIDSVFDSFEARPHPGPESLKVLVILGTERFPFPRAVNAVVEALPSRSVVQWQLGHTPKPPDLPGSARPWFPFEELQQAVQDADVVITHCGVGSVLMALRHQKCPVVIPRTSEHHEHVDDHQSQLARILGESGLALVAHPAAGDVAVLIAQAAKRQVLVRPPQPRPVKGS